MENLGTLALPNCTPIVNSTGTVTFHATILRINPLATGVRTCETTTRRLSRTKNRLQEAEEYTSLTAERIAALENIGFVWTHRKAWFRHQVMPMEEADVGNDVQPLPSRASIRI